MKTQSRTKTNNQAGHRGPANQGQPTPNDPNDPNQKLLGLVASTLPVIADQAREKGIPQDAALVVRFDDQIYDVLCVDTFTAQEMARGIGPELERAFTLTSVFCLLGLSVPVLCVYVADDSGTYASGCTTINRRN